MFACWLACMSSRFVEGPELARPTKRAITPTSGQHRDPPLSKYLDASFTKLNATRGLALDLNPVKQHRSKNSRWNLYRRISPGNTRNCLRSDLKETRGKVAFFGEIWTCKAVKRATTRPRGRSHCSALLSIDRFACTTQHNPITTSYIDISKVVRFCDITA